MRARIFGTTERPRLSVSRSNKGIFAQIIDDTQGKTIVSAISSKIKASTAADSTVDRKGKTALAYSTGKVLGELAKAKGIESVVFDRGGRLYHGRVKAVADGARDAGLKF